jgi:hypothetical protein
MTGASVLILLGLAAIIAALGDEAARQSSRRLGWAAAGGFLLLAAAPLVPNYSILLGFSLDDVLPVLGLALLIPLIPWTRLGAVAWDPRLGTVIAAVGLGAMIAAGVVSAIFIAGTPGDVVRLGLRGAGRLAFLAAIVIVVAVLAQGWPIRRKSATAMAAIGAIEAGFGLIAYFVGLPGLAGLEPTRPGTVLFGEVPGRISGTLGISPNFTAAILMITALVTAGLALGATRRRTRLAWWGLVGLQLAAITLTYTRASLGLVVVALGILVLLRSRPILLVPIGVAVVAVGLFTPMVERVLSDVPNRFALWTSAFRLMADHPIGGVGSGQTLAAIAMDPERYRMTPFGQAWSTAHNTILLAGAETGVLGALGALILNLGLAVVAISVLVRAPRGPEGALAVASSLALLAFLAQGMVNNLLTVGVTGLFAAFLLATQLLHAKIPEGIDVPVGTEAAPRSWSGLVDAWRRRPTQDPGVPVTEDRGGL